MHRNPITTQMMSGMAEASCGSRSLFSETVMQPNGWSADGLIGLPGMGDGILQDDIGVATSVSRHPSIPAIRAFEGTHSNGQSMRSRAYVSSVGASLRVRSLEDGRNVNVPNLYNDVSAESGNLVASLSGLSLSSVGEENHPMQDDYQNLFHLQTNSFPIKRHYYYLSENLNAGRGSPSQYLNTNLLASAPQPGNFARHGNHRSGMDLMGSSYLRSNDYSSATISDMRKYEEYLPSSQVEYPVLQRAAYSDALLPKSPYGLAFVKPSTQTNGFHGNSAFGNPMASPNSTIGSDGPFRHMEHTIAGKFMGPWPSELGYNLEETPAASLLDEFKENKIKFFKLAEISGHIVEFSADQYGSRLIQQKLETASTLEKNTVFLEIMPHALYLMTDVFGNYVIQKFFERGNASQIRQLADQLIGNALTLSLQMYGCRVIQKAIEVVKLDQLTKMAAELDGHVMRCVRDQNGNHVIQKCIEYIPEAAIQFIVTTFYGHAVTLSCHPFGCRVIQRVLEHCHNPKTLSVFINEILQSVCVLAQDQYGNYVIQHLLEHGKPHERSIIISQLIGKTVEMSQQKFASNVIEKCLSFGTPKQRKTLVLEMLGSTNENEPLQVMMKDQFANYVVQKVMETCDDQLLELLLKRMKIHLNTLKKYTYGKHIVSRLQKLVAAGERRISVLRTISA